MNRVVIVGPAYPLRGGIAHFNESLCASLTANGVEARIISFYLQYPALFFPGVRQVETEVRAVEATIEPLISSLNPQSWRKAARHIVALQPQVVLIRFWLPFFGPSLGTLARYLRKAGIKVIGLVDNAIPHERRMFDKSLARYFFQQCDAFVALSQSVARDLEQFSPGKPCLVHPHPVYDIFGPAAGRPEACTALGLDPASRYILFFGFVRPYKGLDLLLEAFGDSRLRGRGLHLLVAGEFYESKQPYLDRMRELGIADEVLLHGHYIPTEQVRHYFAAASLVAQTYRSATQSGVTQIAYHFGRPMLVTDVGGLAEMVPNGEVGYVVPPRKEAIADALVRFFDEDREASFAEKAQAMKSQFSWQHFTEEFLNFATQIYED